MLVFSGRKNSGDGFNIAAQYQIFDFGIFLLWGDVAARGEPRENQPEQIITDHTGSDPRPIESYKTIGRRRSPKYIVVAGITMAQSGDAPVTQSANSSSFGEEVTEYFHLLLSSKSKEKTVRILE